MIVRVDRLYKCSGRTMCLAVCKNWGGLGYRERAVFGVVTFRSRVIMLRNQLENLG